MSDAVVRAKIQQLGQQAKIKEVLQLKRLPPRAQSQTATAQTSTSSDTATPEEIARNKAGDTILKATFRHSDSLW